MVTILTWLKRLFFGDIDQSSRIGKAQNGKTTCTTATVPQDTTTLTQASQAERVAYWKNQPHTTAQEQLQEWERGMDSWFAQLHQDPATWEAYAFLQRLLGGDKNEQAHAPVVVNAQAIYHTFFQSEGNGDIEYFFQRIVRTNTVEQIQRNQELIEHLARMYGEETATRAQPRIAALITGHNLQNGHSQPDGALFSPLGTSIATGEEISLKAGEREQALACFGAIGSGKSTLALNLILQDCRNGRGVVLVEPHGDLTRAVLAGLPESRLDDVVYLDLTACGASPFGLNPFQCDDLQDAAEVAKCANFVHHTFMRTWDFGHHTPVLAMVLRHVTRLLIENPGSSFADIPLIFHDDAAREKLVGSISDAAPHTKAFWQRYNTLSPRERRDLISSTENKIDSYLAEPLIANILSQAKTTLDFGALLNRRAIVLINLSPQLDEIGRLLGSLILGRILMSAYQRASVPESERVPCYVYVDEWSRFCSDDLAVLIAESRKFKVFIGGLFNQTLETISDSNRATALQAGTLVVFRVSGEDAKVLAKSFDATPEPYVVGEEPQRALVSDVLTHLVQRGHHDSRVARFSQTYLHALSHFLKTPTGSHDPKGWVVAYDYHGSLILYDQHLQQGRSFLNDCLYRCMSERNPHLAIPMPAIYLLACAQRDGREAVFSPYIIHVTEGFYGPYSLEGFEPRAAKFGKPEFIEEQSAASFIAAAVKYRKRSQRKKSQLMAEAVVSMLTELRYVMSILAKTPIMIDTGFMVPKYQLRTVQDQQNYVANSLSQQPPFHARIKTLHGEFRVRLRPPPELMCEELVQERICQIKQRMRERGVTKSAGEVLEELRKRHDHLRQRPHSDAPPPSSTTGRPPRRLRQKPPPPFT